MAIKPEDFYDSYSLPSDMLSAVDVEKLQSQADSLAAAKALADQESQRARMLKDIQAQADLISKYSRIARTGTESTLPEGLPGSVGLASAEKRLGAARKAAEIESEMNRKIFPVQPNPLNVPSQAPEQVAPAPATATPEAAPTPEKPQYDPFEQFSELMRQRDDFRAKAFQYAKQTLPREDWLDAMSIADKYVSERFKAPQNIAQPIIDQFTGKPLEGYALIGGKVEKIEKPKVEEDGRSVIGYEGKAPTQAEAVKFRESVSEINSGVRALDELIQIGRKGSSLSPTDRAKAQNLARMIQGKFRPIIVGPGAVTENDREVLEQVISNPLQIFTLVDIPALLADMKYRVLSDQNDRAAILGLKPTGQSSQPSQGGGGAVNRMRFDTSGKRIQ